MDSITELITKLKLDDAKDKNTTLQELINSITAKEAGEERESLCDSLVKDGVLDGVRLSLSAGESHVQFSAQLIAELAKTELVREECTKQDLVEKFTQHINTGHLPTSVQVCRALGNICYDYDPGRDRLAKCQGLTKLVNLMKVIDDDVTDEDHQKLRLMSCGCLLNVTHTFEPLQDLASELSVFELLNSYLKKYCSDDDDLVSMILLTISCLVDSDKGRASMVKTALIETCIDLYETSKVDDVEESIIDMLSTIAESDDVKTLLCKTSLPSHLISSVKRREKCTDEDSASILKAASDLLILLLIGNESMETLYHKSTVYEQCVNWMNSENEYMCMSGALAVGNYARGDQHSSELVESGMVPKLLSVLKRQNEQLPSIIIVHAVLSALRNLAIPSCNKSTMVNNGVITESLRFYKCQVMPIQFKLYGLLRMLVDGQESTAETLGTNVEFVEEVVASCSVIDHAGVKGEAIRLLAWLVKNSPTRSIIETIINANGLPILVNMLTIEHTVMQNEALVALTLIAATLIDDHWQSFLDSNLVTVLSTFLTNETLQPEVTLNSLALTRALTKSNCLKSALKTDQMTSALCRLKSSDHVTIRHQAGEIGTILGLG